MTHPMARIESALQEGNFQLANDLLKENRNRSQMYYQVIRDGLVATFYHLESSGEHCSEWDSFCYCSNALLELDVKNVPISVEMQMLVMHKLSSYGLRRLCGYPTEAEKKISWRDSIDCVVRWVEELRHRSKCYDFLDIDDQVMFRVRMIHNHLFYVKNRRELRGLPLKKMVFCLAIFARIYCEDPEYLVYRMVINKRNLMQFLVGIVSRLKDVIFPGVHARKRKSNVLKKLSKTYRKLKQIHSVNKIMRNVRIHKEFGTDDSKRSNAAISLAAFKRFNQICGEAIKTTSETPNLTEKLCSFLSRMLTAAITLNSKFRNLSCHGFPLSQLYQRESDEMIFYRNLTSYIQLTAEVFYSFSVFILIDCYRYLYGMMRRCQTNEDLCSLIRYVGSSAIRSTFESEIEDDENYNKAIEEVLDSYCTILTEVEIMAFANAPITAIHYHLQAKFTNKTVLDLLIADQKVQSPRDVSKHQYYIQRHMEFSRFSNEEWYHRKRTRQILSHFTCDVQIEASTFAQLEDKLHGVFSKPRKGYYHNIFSLDSKIQTIKSTLKNFLVGPKSSNGFKSRNRQFTNKLITLRRQDESELSLIFRKIILNLQDAFNRSGCDTIHRLVRNSDRMPLKYRLAIEYWQLQAMEILNSSGYFGDNFNLLTKSIPMIWGRSYRNYLAHDSLSYDTLTASGSLKILINGFVLAFDSSGLNVFSRSPKYKLEGLLTLETQVLQWLEVQSSILKCLKNGDISELSTCFNLGAELRGKHLLPPGRLLRPKLCDLRVLICHEQLNPSRYDVVSQLLSKQFYSDIYLAVQLNLLQISNLPIQEAIQQFESIQPELTAPAIGTVLSHLVSTGDIQLLKSLVDRHVGLKVGCSIDRMTTSCMLLDPNYYSSLSLPQQLAIALIQRNVWTFGELVQRWSTNPKQDGSDALEIIMERCCYYGRVEMVRCVLNSGLKTTSNCLRIAIEQHHWDIVDLLLANDSAQLDAEVLLHVLSKRNFKMVRRMLEEPMPAENVEMVVEKIVHFGSKRLVKYLVQLGVDVFQCNSVLSSALRNKDPSILQLLEEMLLQSAKLLIRDEAPTFWISMFQDMITLAMLCLDPDFISKMILKPTVVKRWTTRIENLLMIDRTYLVERVHFVDDGVSFVMNLSLLHSVDFKELKQKCVTCFRLMQGLSPNLIILKAVTNTTIRTPSATIHVEINATLYSTSTFCKYFDDLPTLISDGSLHMADSISKNLRDYLSKFSHLKLATATISAVNDPTFQRLFYFQIESSSCILQQSSRNQFKLPFMFNRPDQPNILHNLQPDSHPAVVDSLLHLGADPTHTTGRSETPFHTALFRPFPLALIKLMHRHCIPSHVLHETNIFNRKDHNGHTPLQAAVATNSFEVVEFMLQNGADPTIANRRGDAVILGVAILNRNVRMVKLLIRSCPTLLQKYVQVDKRSTALEVAVSINHDHIVQLLLDSGAELNGGNENCAALKCAIQYEAVESLQVILEFAIRSKMIIDNDIDGHGRTALEYAKEHDCCLEVMRALISYSIRKGYLSCFNYLQK